jgi:hypothetical protein
MPNITQYKCENYTKCKFVIIDTGSTMHVKLEDGTTKKLVHPSEEARALALTGKNTAELMEEKRIFYHDNKFCSTCYKLEDECVCKDKAAHTAVSELEGKNCPICKSGIIKKSVVGMS